MEDARKVFDSFDVDESGTIEAKELKVCMRSLGFEASKKELANMLIRADDNG